MANYFNSLSRSVAGMPKLPIAVAVLGLFIISLTVGWEDYSTNLAGYAMFPTRKINDWVIPFTAALPQVGQIAFLYGFAVNTNSRWKLLVALAFHLMDVSTDVYFKAAGQSLGVWVLAFFESEIIFTLGSEIALTFCIGLLPAILPGAIRELREMFAEIADELTSRATGTPPSNQRQEFIPHAIQQQAQQIARDRGRQ